MARDLRSILHGSKPAGVMVVVQIVFAGVNVFYKLAINDGMSLKVLVAYRYIFGTGFLVPVAFLIERKSRPRMTWTVLFQSFLCGLFGGSLAQNLYIGGLAMTSATFATAMTNLIPAITFIMALFFRLEKLEVRAISGQAKVLGTVLGIGGAMLLTFYKGTEINLWSTNVNLIHYGNASASHVESGNRVMGSLLFVGSCFCYSIWLIIQAKMMDNYPCHYTCTALMCLMGSIQALLYALCVEKDWSQWKIGWNVRLFTVAYSGIVASGLVVALMAWCIQKRGPLFVSIFNPLMHVIVAIVGSFILDEKLHLGSVIGAVFIVIGLYAVLWGKGKELEKKVQLPLINPRELRDSSVVSENLDTETEGFGSGTDLELKEEKMVSSLSVER